MKELETCRLPIANLVLSKTNPRSKAEPQAMKELVESVRQHGVISSIVVRPLADPNGNGTHEIVCGERRFNASKLAELLDIPVRIFEMTDQEAQQVQIIENMQREGIHYLDELEGYLRLLDFEGFTPDLLAERIGKKKTYIYSRLKLADLDPKVVKVARGGGIPEGVAVELARIAPADQLACLKAIDPPDLTVSNVRSWVAGNVCRRLADAPFSQEDAELVKAAGPCTTCPKRTGANRLLFADIKEPDICMDSTCYESKVSALIRLKEDAGAKQMIYDPSGYSNEERLPKGMLVSGSVRVLKKEDATCEHAVDAVVARTYYAQDAERIGQVMKVCPNKECAVHKQAKQTYRGYSESPESREKRLAEQRESKIKSEILGTLFYELSRKLSERGPRAMVPFEWRSMAAWALQDLGFFGCQEIAKYFGYNRQKLNAGKDRGKDHIVEPDDFMASYVKELPEKEVPGFVLSVAFRQVDRMTDMPALCKDYGIDAKAVKKRVRESKQKPKPAAPGLKGLKPAKKAKAKKKAK